MKIDEENKFFNLKEYKIVSLKFGQKIVPQPNWKY